MLLGMVGTRNIKLLKLYLSSNLNITCAIALDLRFNIFIYVTEHLNRMKNILLCVVGLTPQSITETLYILTQQRGEFVDEIFAITTLKGYEKTRQTLLDPKTGKFWQFCKDFAIDSQKINFSENNIFLLKASDGNTLSDIRFIKDNQVAANQICEIVSPRKRARMSCRSRQRGIAAL